MSLIIDKTKNLIPDNKGKEVILFEHVFLLYMFSFMSLNY
jgi:hypothetical protein